MFGKIKAKKKLKQNISDIIGLKAEYLPKKILLVNKDFHLDLVQWLTRRGKQPKNFDTSKLLTKGKLKPDLTRGVDYEIINPNIWPDLIETFGTTDKIEAKIIKHPTTGREILITNDSKMLQFNIYLPSPNNMNGVSSSPIQYYSSPDWFLKDVKKKICLYYNYNPSTYSLARHSSTNPDEQISENFKMGVVFDSYSSDLDLRPTKSSTIYPHKKSSTSMSSNQINFDQNSSSRPSTVRKAGSSLKSTKKEPISTQKVKNSIEKIEDINSPTKSTYETNSKSTQKVQKPIEKFEDINGPTKYSYKVLSHSYPRPLGLRNLGNTCFFNAAVQCLVRVMPLTDFILSDGFESQLNPRNRNSSGCSIARSYRRLLENFCNPTNSSSIDPSNLRSCVISKYTRFADHSQHDSQELLCSLLDGLHEDMNQSSSCYGREKPIKVTQESDGWTVHLSRNSSPIVDLFHGVLSSCLTCPNCKHVEEVRDPFVFLSLPIPRKFSSIKLEDCLSNFSRSEVLDSKNKWKCERCKKLVCATKETGIEKCGKKVLIIHLKRFSGDGQFNSKIDTPVDYPDIIDIGRFAKKDCGRFRLIGAVFHSGGLGGGHYTAAAIDPASDAWYSFNDSMASKIGSERAHSRAAYILFYLRID